MDDRGVQNSEEILKEVMDAKYFDTCYTFFEENATICAGCYWKTLEMDDILEFHGPL